jgi:regulator of RNase E activity RraA
VKTNRPPLPHGTLIELRRWNTPTIYNGLETYSKADRRSYVNLEEVHDFMPQMGPMVGYAITMVLQPGNPEHVQRNPDAWQQYRAYVAGVPGPKIVVVQDLDKPLTWGTGWGEVIGNLHRALGCVGVIVDGGIRDLDEMCYAGFKALARRLCVSHCHAWPVRWGCEVEVFGTTVKPGQLVHADKHGFVAVPLGEEKKLLEAARFMDTNECMTMIPSARATAGLTNAEITAQVDEAWRQFGRNAAKKSIGKGEWG